MITMGKITHNRIAGSSKSSAMMKREASSFSCLLGNLASHKKSGNEITSYGKRRRQTKGSYMKYEALKFDEEYSVYPRFLAQLENYVELCKVLFPSKSLSCGLNLEPRYYENNTQFELLS